MSEVWLSLLKRTHGHHVHTQSGVLDNTVFPGPTFGQVMEAYTRLTGRPILPPMFALAYHQCRWNYRDQKDVEEVYAKFEEVTFLLT